jgi:hypothetical protein
VPGIVIDERCELSEVVLDRSHRMPVDDAHAARAPGVGLRAGFAQHPRHLVLAARRPELGATAQAAWVPGAGEHHPVDHGAPLGRGEHEAPGLDRGPRGRARADEQQILPDGRDEGRRRGRRRERECAHQPLTEPLHVPIDGVQVVHAENAAGVEKPAQR